ncbi:hypothetical protein [Halobacillus locisalis]|uniref:hypothetical protein n=1 Tax=Halobacillus locisalis TaxID=220753 RepID=UPI001FE74C20|nr:hypothetical protein [Halobacillus locisalis]
MKAAVRLSAQPECSDARDNASIVQKFHRDHLTIRYVDMGGWVYVWVFGGY